MTIVETMAERKTYRGEVEAARARRSSLSHFQEVYRDTGRKLEIIEEEKADCSIYI